MSINPSEPRSIHSFYRVNLTQELGRGTTARVVKGVRLSDNEEVAIKIISRVSLSERRVKHFAGEILSLSKLNHNHIVKLYDLFEDAQNAYIVMELVNGGELFERIARKRYYNESEARDLCCYILSAIEHCHSQDVVHRDIKPENLLMQSPTTDVNIKLCDFGFSEIAPLPTLMGYYGTPIYMAPEVVIRTSPYGKAVDMWSFGVLVYIILCGYPPFYNAEEAKLREAITTAAYVFHDDHWSRVSADAKHFINRLLCLDPRERMTASEAMNHPWLKASMEKLCANDITDALERLRDFNAKRKIRSAVHSIIAVKRLQKSMLENSIHIPHEEESPHLSATSTDSAGVSFSGSQTQDDEEDESPDRPMLQTSKSQPTQRSSSQDSRSSSPSKSPSRSASTNGKSQNSSRVGFGIDNQRINMDTFMSRIAKPTRKPVLSLIAAVEAIAPGSVLSSLNCDSRRGSGNTQMLGSTVATAALISNGSSSAEIRDNIVTLHTPKSPLMNKQPSTGSASSPTKSQQLMRQSPSRTDKPPSAETLVASPAIIVDVKAPATYSGYLFKHGHFNYIRRFMVLESGVLKIYTDESKREFKNENLLYLYTLVVGNTVTEDGDASSVSSKPTNGRYRNYSDDRGSSFSLATSQLSYSTSPNRSTNGSKLVQKTDLVLLGRVPTISSIELQCLDSAALPKWIEAFQQHIFYSMSTHQSVEPVKVRSSSRQLRQSTESDFSDAASQGPIDLPHFNTNTTEQLNQALSKFNTGSGNALFPPQNALNEGDESKAEGEDEDEESRNNRLMEARALNSNRALELPSSEVMNPILMGTRRRFSLDKNGIIIDSHKTPVGSLDDTISQFDYPPLTQGRVQLRSAWWVFSSWTTRYLVLEMGMLRVYSRRLSDYPYGEGLEFEVPIFHCVVKHATFDSGQILLYMFHQPKNERSMFALPIRSLTIKPVNEALLSDDNHKLNSPYSSPSSHDWLKRFKQSIDFYNNTHPAPHGM